MTTLAVKINIPKANNLNVTEDTLTVELDDGRTISVPLAWYPRLQEASVGERNNWRLVGGGQGMHWSDIDEDISVQGIISGTPSGESQNSFKRWLESRQAC